MPRTTPGKPSGIKLPKVPKLPKSKPLPPPKKGAAPKRIGRKPTYLR